MRQRTGLFSVVMLMTLLVTVGQSLAGPVPDTGQTKCYDGMGNEIACPQPGEPFYGQDAQYAGPNRSYTKLGQGGVELPETATAADGWIMNRDNVTGLIWEIKTDDGSIHDQDSQYTWYDNNPATNGGFAGTAGNGTDTEDFIASLNAANFGGYSDWRLPTVKELSTLVHAGVCYPAIDTKWFPFTASSHYWSSTTFTFANSADSAWSVYYGNGGVTGIYKSDGYYVRAVRGEQPPNESGIIDNGDGTVSDTETGLMWQKATAPGYYKWQQALAYAEGLILAGYSDWRLPNRNELQTLVDYSRNDPAIDPLLASDTVSSYYWSSTTDANITYRAWLVFFFSGNVESYSTGNYSYVRAVRAGQSGSLDPSVISINVNGPASVYENSSGSYTLTANYSDGSSETVTGAVTWSVDSAYASIANDGTLTALSVDADQTVTLSAAYSDKSATKTITIVNGQAGSPSLGYNVSSELWAKAVLEVSGNPVALVWHEVGADLTPSGDQVISGYFYADPADFAYGSRYNPELFVKIYITTGGWCNIAFNHVTVDPVTVYSAHGYAGTADQTGSATLQSRLVQHEYTGVAIDTSKQSSGGTSAAASGSGYTLGSNLWSHAVLQVATNPVTPVDLVWKEVGTDTTPSGAKVISGYFYADPADFAYGSPFNPEVFVKVYIDPTGWANMAFNHVTVDPVSIESAHQYGGASQQSGGVTLNGRLVEHSYTGVPVL